MAPLLPKIWTLAVVRKWPLQRAIWILADSRGAPNADLDPRSTVGLLPLSSVSKKERLDVRTAQFVGARVAATIHAMTTLQFNVVFEDAGDGWVYAHVPELPEVQTQGASLDEAREMVRDAIMLVLEDRRADGKDIPGAGWALVERLEIAA